MDKNVVISVRMSKKTREKLKKLAKKDKRELSGYCCVVLENHIDEMEEE